MSKREKKETSQKKIDSNRRNAKKSTGPKSTEGKETVSKNAVKHGLYSDDIVIQSAAFSESKAEYNQLVCSLYDELKPVSQLQEHLVTKIANCLWRSQRVIRAETAHINAQMDDINRDVRDAAYNKKWCSGLDRDKDDTALTPEETQRVIENGIGQRCIPTDSTSQYILRFEMRLDRQLTRAYQMLRQLQSIPKPTQNEKTSLTDETNPSDKTMRTQTSNSNDHKETVGAKRNQSGLTSETNPNAERGDPLAFMDDDPTLVPLSKLKYYQERADLSGRGSE